MYLLMVCLIITSDAGLVCKEPKLNEGAFETEADCLAKSFALPDDEAFKNENFIAACVTSEGIDDAVEKRQQPRGDQRKHLRVGARWTSRRPVSRDRDEGGGQVQPGQEAVTEEAHG